MGDQLLQDCAAVLVGPMFGGNVGAAARAVKNTGLGELVIVAPSYPDHEEALKFCHGAEDVLEQAPRHDDLIEAIGSRQRVVGFTARGRRRRAMQSLRAFAADWVTQAREKSVPTALLFGRERDGLSNEELDLCTDLVWIPAHPDHPSYNLAQAVLLVGYELFTAGLEVLDDAPRARPRMTRTPRRSPPASAAELHDLSTHLRQAFLGIGYAYPHTVNRLMRSYQEMFSRARLHQREAKMIRGLAHQMLWAVEQIDRANAADRSRTERTKTDDDTSG